MNLNVDHTASIRYQTEFDMISIGQPLITRYILPGFLLEQVNIYVQ